MFSSTYTLPSSGDDEAEATESVQAATSSNTCVTPGSPLVSCTSPVKPLNECVAGLHTSTPHTPTASLYSAHSKVLFCATCYSIVAMNLVGLVMGRGLVLC